MRPYAFALLASTILGMFAAPPHAHAAPGPWCVMTSEDIEDCSQPSEKMCRLTIANTPSMGHCYPNPAYRAPARTQRPETVPHRAHTKPVSRRDPDR